MSGRSCLWTIIRGTSVGRSIWRIKKQLEANVAWADGEGSGAAKAGPALLSGLLRCGRCGRKLQVAYSGNDGRVPRYVCRGDRGNRDAKGCLTIGSLRVDRAVVGSVLAAIEPAGIEAAIKLSECVQAEDEEKRKALELALQRARFEADRARRQFDAAEPENRLVAAELETRWNQTLQQVADLQARIIALGERRTSLSDEQRAELIALGEDVWAVWDHAEAPVQLKKRILRTVLNEIVVDSQRDSPRHRLILHWAGGVHTELYVERNLTGQHRRSAERTVIDLVSELAKVCPDKNIAAILNRLGYKTGQEKNWNASRVAGLRGYHEIVPFQRQDGWVTQQQAARELKVSDTVIKRLIREGVLPATQVVSFAPWIIDRKDLQLPAVQAQVRAVHSGRRPPPIVPDQGQLSLK